MPPYFDNARLLSCLSFFAFLAIVLAFYWSGLSGGFWLDDYSNLPIIFEQLKSDGLLYAVSNGQAGPLGRPLSLLSFAVQGDAWPAARGFIAGNIAIHFLNSLCVFILALELLKLGPVRLERNAPWYLALIVAMLWACAPIQVSSVLYVVQRMTLLSSFFVLLGLLAFVYGHVLIRVGRERTGLVVMCILGPIFGFLGLLAKETAFLLVVYLLVVDYWLGGQFIVRNVFYRRVVRGLLYVITAAFVVYLIYLVFQPGGYGNRDFNVQERLMTQSRIVLEYLRQILLPRVSSLGLFHETYPVSRGLFAPMETVYSLIVWLGLGGLLIAALRRSWFLLGFAMLWFVGGHLLESTTLSLELYFEHRNYLPSFGVWFTVILGVHQAFHRWVTPQVRNWVSILCLAYIALLGGQGYYMVSLWGQPDRLAYIYTQERKESIRAREMMLYIYQRRGEMDLMAGELDFLGRDFPENLTVKLMQLEYACLYPDVFSYDFSPSLLELAQRQKFAMGAVGAVSDLFDRIEGEKQCSGFNMEQLLNMLAVLSSNPAYKTNVDGIHSLRSEVLLSLGRTADALLAMQSVGQPIYQMAVREVQLLAMLGRVDEALLRLNEIEAASQYSLQVRAHQAYLAGIRQEIIAESNFKY